MNLLRWYLLSGLIVHKLVWEALKWRRRRPSVGRVNRSVRLTVVKAVKIGVLLGICAQTILPEVLPIAQEPTALRIVGTLLYTAGLLMAIAGRFQLGDNWSDIEAARIVRDQAVVSRGLYRFIRHPIYAGDLLLLLGLELSLNSWLALAVVLLMPVVFWRALREERLLVRALPGYDTYCLRTKRFIPFVV
jgi:protein-S-isoprenylcysteine O-methyltransferase Ste14